MLAHTSGFAGEAGKVVLLLSDNAEVYRAVANDTIRDILKRCHHTFLECSRISFESVVDDVTIRMPVHDADLLIAFGSKAARDPSVLGFKGQLILSMIPRHNFAGEALDHREDSTIKIFIDQPYKRYFELIKTIMPRAVHVGVLLDPSDSSKRKSMLEAASNTGLELIIREVDSNSQIGEALSELRGSIDVLLALPDSRIHNSRTISNILTTSYRNHIPVIGFSSSYVKAGAIAAVYTSLEDISHQVADAAIETLTGTGIARHAQQADYFSVSINHDVAHSLGIVIPSSGEVKEAMLRELSK